MVSSTSTWGDDRPAGVPRDPSSSVAVPGPQTHAERAASMEAYYAAAQGFVHGGMPQRMVAAAAAPYGAPVPFPMYHPAYYAHASMAAGVPCPAGEAAVVVEGSSTMKSSCAPSGDGSSRSSVGGSGESSDKRESAQTDLKVLPSAKRSKPSNANVKGESSQAGTTQDAAAESSFAAQGRSASKLSVTTPERALVSDAAPNSNIGMDISGRPPAEAVTSEQGKVNAGAPSQHAGALSQMYEGELKKDRRKQSNIESARRPRLLKQQECEELAKKVTHLRAVNGALRLELNQLKKACEDMDAENSQLMGEMKQIDASKGHPGNNGHLHKNNEDSKG